MRKKRPSWSTRSPSHSRRISPSASSSAASWSPGDGQSSPSGDSLSDSPEPIPTKMRPGYIASRVAKPWATSDRVVALERDGDRRPDRDALGRLRGGAEPDPGVAGVAGLPPRLQVVGAGDPVEPGLLAGDGLRQEVARTELLVRTAEEVAGHRARLPAGAAGENRGGGRRRPRPRGRAAPNHLRVPRSGRGTAVPALAPIRGARSRREDDLPQLHILVTVPRQGNDADVPRGHRLTAGPRGRRLGRC